VIASTLSLMNGPPPPALANDQMKMEKQVMVDVTAVKRNGFR
jgi:hypothetical protein